MRKLIARYDKTTTAQSVATADANSVTGVTATLEIDLIPAVIVDVKPGQVNAVERRLRQRRSITKVERPKQAVPHVVDPQYLTDFFARVDRERGYQLPLAGSQTRTEVVTQAAETQRELQQRKQATPDDDREISTVDEAYANIGADPTAVDTSNVIAANLDEGVHPSQFASERRMSGFSPTDAGPYEPSGSHGSYTMGVLAGGPATTGIDRAPLSEADIYPLRINFGDADMLACLDHIDKLRAAEDRPIIFNNSWGYLTCTGLCNFSITEAFTVLAAKPGIVIIASAGNEARDCGQSCTGTGNNGINAFQTAPNVISVALSGEFGNPRKMLFYSSRGPGSCNDTLEPTTIAPLNGIVPYGDGSKDLGANVGTSGAAPMVAAVIGQGIAAAGHDVSTQDITDVIKNTGVQWKGSGHSICTGWGEINPPTTVPAIATQPPDDGDQLVTAAFEPRTTEPLPINDAVLFDAGNSEASVGRIEAYNWTVTNGEFTDKFNDLRSITPTGGQLDVTLTVRDEGGRTDSTTNQYQVEEPPNKPPTARATVTDNTVTPPATVTFDGGGSTDVDGRVVSYEWAFSNASSQSGESVSLSFGEGDVGVTTGTLAVTDDDGATDTATASVTVQPPSNQPPTARVAVSDTNVVPPATVRFDASDSTDSDGFIRRYGWEFSDGATPNGPVVQRTFDSSDSGTISGTVTVTDDDGASDIATAAVTVEQKEGQQPQARVSVAPSEIVPPGVVSFDGSESVDPGGSIRSYQWTFSDGAERFGSRVTRQVDDSLSALTGELQVEDTDGNTDTATGTVQVREGESDRPVARITPSEDTITPPATVQISGQESSQPNGEIVAYQWSLGDSGTATGEVINKQISGYDGSEYPIQLTVTGQNGQTDTTSVTISIKQSDEGGENNDEVVAQAVIVGASVVSSVVLTGE